jgi:leader peptidase (prepilin peptidase)/N-methyltransferase
LLLISWLFFLWKKKMGLGGGDLKMFAMIGAWLGIGALYPVLFLASILALVAQPVFMVLKRVKWIKPESIYGNGILVFGPYLAVAAGIMAVFPGIGGWLLQ